MPMVGLFGKRNGYMLITIKDVVDESIDDGGFTDSLIAQEDNFVLKEGRNAALTQVEIAYISHVMGSLKV